MLEVAIELMNQKKTPQSIMTLINEVLEIKGLDDPDGTFATQYRYSLCVLMCELIDNLGVSEARRCLLESCDDFDVIGLRDILLSNISLRKRCVLLGFYLKGYLKGVK